MSPLASLNGLNKHCVNDQETLSALLPECTSAHEDSVHVWARPVSGQYFTRFRVTFVSRPHYWGDTHPRDFR